MTQLVDLTVDHEGFVRCLTRLGEYVLGTVVELHPGCYLDRSLSEDEIEQLEVACYAHRARLASEEDDT